VLLKAAAGLNRGFDAVAVGEYERAFCGGQLSDLVSVLAEQGVQLWLPELGGPVDLADPAHQALVMLLGQQSKREVLRARFRTVAAMRVQARDQGRHLGGRPPYGYRLVDAGPLGSPAAPARPRSGDRADRVPDLLPPRHRVQHVTYRPRDARRAGRDALPSGYDPYRNRHRSGEAWTLRTVAEILANPRYTGRQVWNRQRTDHQPITPGLPPQRRNSTRRWNPRNEWIVSREVVHPPLVSEHEYVTAHKTTAAMRPADGSTRRYQLTGLVRCATCGRRMVGPWVHGRPGLRCRHGHTSANPPRQHSPKRLYIREERLLAALADQLGEGDDIAGSLRAAGITLMWDGITVTLETEHGGPSQDRRGV
jgi:hypothetical protein